MKFRAHETFFIRKGWLSKGLKNVEKNPEVFVSKTEHPMDNLGIGSNMVKSLRYWLQAVGLTVEPKFGKRYQELTELGRLVFNNDRYFEEIGTLLLLHYKLAINEENATSWYYFFNVFDLKEFDKEDFVKHINNYLAINNVEVSKNSIEQDFNCILNSYLPKNKDNESLDPENNIDCPFKELGILDVVDSKKKIYRFKSIKKDLIHPLILLAIIVDQAKGSSEIRILSIYKDLCNAGKVFKLDLITLTNLLFNLEVLGYIKVIRTAGLDIIKIEKNLNFNQCVQEYYSIINN